MMANKIQFEHLQKWKKERRLNKKDIVQYYGQKLGQCKAFNKLH